MTREIFVDLFSNAHKRLNVFFLHFTVCVPDFSLSFAVFLFLWDMTRKGRSWLGLDNNSCIKRRLYSLKEKRMFLFPPPPSQLFIGG